METRTIKTWRDPYDEGFNICKPKEVEFKRGLTVLVGCNGAGKSTMLDNIISRLKEEKVPYHKFDNLTDGGSNAISSNMFDGDIGFASTAICSSEGENISINMGTLAHQLGHFIKNGWIDNKTNRFMRNLMILDGKEVDNEIKTNERWLLLDAVDSGLSIDNVIELKDFFNFVITDCERRNIDMYIIISANGYELANEVDCFDVNSGKYIKFSSYEDYKKFILNSRKKKDKRYEKLKKNKENNN